MKVFCHQKDCKNNKEKYCQLDEITLQLEDDFNFFLCLEYEMG